MMQPPLSDHQARAEAERCLLCFDAPCTTACPTRIDIPRFISMIRSGNIKGAAETVRTSNAMAGICGQICPEEVFCQSACARAKQDSPIAIRELHFHATRHELSDGWSVPTLPKHNGLSVAVIGAGPAGLACAFELAKFGYHVSVHDRRPAGGVPLNSIPGHRLSGEVVAGDVGFVSRFLEIRIEDVDRRLLAKIRNTHAAVFVAVGLASDRSPALPGADLSGVLPVIGFLESARRGTGTAVAGKRVLIIGGGNVSLDAAATAKLAGAREVILTYRRGEREMRVWKSELDEARRSGVHMLFQTTPVEIVGRGKVEGVRCRRTRLSDELDESGRAIPIDIEGSDFLLEADTVISAIGQVPDADFLGLFERTPRGFLKVDDCHSTSVPGVFAGGDVVSGEGSVVQSVGDGTRAARDIHAYLSGRNS